MSHVMHDIYCLGKVTLEHGVSTKQHFRVNSVIGHGEQSRAAELCDGDVLVSSSATFLMGGVLIMIVFLFCCRSDNSLREKLALLTSSAALR